MRFPSKVTPYLDSIFPLAIKNLKLMGNDSIKILELYKKSGMVSTEFIDSLCLLYALKKIQLNEQGELENVIRVK